MDAVRPEVLPRSFLYVPANQPGLFPKASAGPADALIFDLEDAVPFAEKPVARKALSHWLGSSDRRAKQATAQVREPQIWVRISADSIGEDLAAVVGPALAGVFLAKCTEAAIAETDRELALLEHRHGLVSGSIGIIGLLESAQALNTIDALFSCQRLLTLAIGEVDLMADLRMARNERTEGALDSIRSRIVIACAAAGLLPPVAPTSTAIRELGAFEESSNKMHDLGFRSRTAIHPSQVNPIHDVFTPSQDQVVSAQDVIHRFDQSGGGVALDAAGRLIDAAVVRGARETIQRAVSVN